MKNNFFSKVLKKLDYLLIIGLWLLIFGKNAFSQMLFLEYVPKTYLSTLKLLFLSDFTSILSLVDLLNLILTQLNLLGLAFQLGILLSMLVSYFYIKRILKNEKNNTLFSILFAFVFFFNPFVYSRIITGEFGFIISYLLLPLYIYYLLGFFEKGANKKSLLKLVLALTLVSVSEIHFFIINALIFIIASFWFYFYKNKEKKVLKYLKFTLILIALTIILNAFWIQGIFSDSFSKIEPYDQSSLVNKNIPTVAKIIGLSGFWREPSQISTFDVLPLPLWYLLLGLIIVSVFGAYYFSNDKRTKFFFTLFWLGLLITIIIPYFDYTTPIKFFRDSNKFESLIALSYAYLLPKFFLGIKEKSKRLKFFPILILVALIILLSLPQINLSDQIKPATYPNDYKELNKFFESKELSGKIIYLPWQNYLTYDWTKKISSDGRIKVPINEILTNEVITGPDKWEKETEKTSKISACINSKSIKCLEENSVEYIIKDKCTTYLDKYSWIEKNVSKKAFENNCIEVYELNNSPYKREGIPDRFLYGVIISVLTLISILFLIRKFSKHTATF